MSTKISTLRLIGKIEGWSYLSLLFVAMPLKYIGDIAMAVKIVGSVHGILFITFVSVLVATATTHRWSYTFSLIAFIASLVPFGTFFLNKKLTLIEKEAVTMGAHS